MKKILILFLTMLLTVITCFSSDTFEITKNDSIVLISSEELKYANLIFIEHRKLLKENILLNKQIDNYQLKTNYLLEIDSLRIKQINEYISLNEYNDLQISNLNKLVKQKDKTIKGWQIGSITISIGLILFLIFK